MPMVIGELLVRLEASTEGLQKITYWMNKVYEALALAMGISDVAEDSDEGEAPAPDEPADAE